MFDAVTRHIETYSHHGTRYISVDGTEGYANLHFKV
jgi:hypothetical protein